MIEWSNDAKNGYDDLEVYMEYGYVCVSTTGGNHANMAYRLSNSAKFASLKQIICCRLCYLG